MSKPSPTVAAEVRYELQIRPGPFSTHVAGHVVRIEAGNDCTCIVQIVTSNGARIASHIAGILTDPTAMLNLREFIAAGGGITLSSELDDG